jgi:hypothetical protein
MTWPPELGRGRVLPTIDPEGVTALAVAGRDRAVTTLADGTGLVWDTTKFRPNRLTATAGAKEVAGWWVELAEEPAVAWRLADAPPNEVVPALGRHLRATRIDQDARPDHRRSRWLVIVAGHSDPDRMSGSTAGSGQHLFSRNRSYRQRRRTPIAASSSPMPSGNLDRASQARPAVPDGGRRCGPGQQSRPTGSRHFRPRRALLPRVTCTTRPARETDTASRAFSSPTKGSQQADCGAKDALIAGYRILAGSEEGLGLDVPVISSLTRGRAG